MSGSQFSAAAEELEKVALELVLRDYTDWKRKREEDDKDPSGVTPTIALGQRSVVEEQIMCCFPINLVVSACLMGHSVSYHANDRNRHQESVAAPQRGGPLDYLQSCEGPSDSSSPGLIRALSLCPEVDLLGLGCPRPPIYLHAVNDDTTPTKSDSEVRVGKLAVAVHQKRLPTSTTTAAAVSDSSVAGNPIDLTQQVAAAFELLRVPTTVQESERSAVLLRVPHGMPDRKRIRLWDRNWTPPSSSSTPSVPGMCLEVDGWIGKSRSPSCGVSDARIYTGGAPGARDLKAQRVPFLPKQDGVFTANLFQGVPSISSRLLWTKGPKGEGGWDTAESEFRRFLEKVIRRKVLLKCMKP
jgi:uncharacterized protein YbbK (DUF523 family)